MTFTIKDWKDSPNQTTPLSAAALEDLEQRLSAYVDLVAGTPHGSVETSSINTTTSGTLVDVPGMSCTVTLALSGHIAVWASFEVESSTPQASTVGVAVQVDGVDHLEHQRFLSGANDKGIGAIVHHADDSGDPFAPGIYTVKLRFRRASGSGTPGLNNASLFALGTYGS